MFSSIFTCPFTTRRAAEKAVLAAFLAAAISSPAARADDNSNNARNANLRQQVAAGLERAVQFYHGKVASHGGYVYHYTLDLKRRWGEGEATRDQIWVQPPGTPTVGMAFLDAYEATGKPLYLRAARDAAKALLYGQLKSGGWTYAIDFDPRGRRVAQYRNGRGGGKNYSSLDDDKTQSALRFLMRLDRVLKFQDPELHAAVERALDALLAAQFPSGGFPQVWTGPAPRHPAKRASYPDYDWRTEGRIKNYWDMPTLNDNLAGTVARTLEQAHATYGDKRYLTALQRLGDFLILAQMPDPQPAWAQQYNHDMHPIWARKFEPPAITGGESQDALWALLAIYRVTGKEKHLAPAPRAIAYLKRSRLADGRLARYYELRTNRPLYMKRRGKVYTLTYSDDDLPSHYAFKVNSKLDAIEREYLKLKKHGPPPRGEPTRPKLSRSLEQKARAVLAQLDEQGRWVSTAESGKLTGQLKLEPGTKYLSSAVFAKNVGVLADYLAAT